MKAISEMRMDKATAYRMSIVFSKMSDLILDTAQLWTQFENV